ncbi:MAG: hypothetical protein NT025_09015 [bacterium]|nr:hypothetical protein [bacterium]
MRVVTLPTGIAPQDFGWDAPYWPWGAVPQDVRVTVETLEGEIIAQHVIGYDVYWLSPLLHSTWLWTHDAVEACRNGDMGCWGAILGVIPGLDPIATPLAFADGICRAEELRNAGNSGWGLQVGRTVFETVELPYEIELPSSEFDARQEAFDCLKPIVHENLPELDDAVRAVEFVSNLELLFIPDYESPYFLYDQYRAYIAVSGAFSEGLNVYERSQLLSIEVPIEAKSRDASYARSTLDTIGISDGLVIPFEDDNILLGHLGRRATAAGDSLAHNQYRSAVFGHTAARAETIGVSFLHVLPDCTTQRLDWTGLVVDSAGGFRIPASDTTDCIKMFMDQDGDGMFEQTVYPEVGGASIRLVVMVDGDSIRLSWKPVYCASSYRVYWGSALDEITTQLTETADTTCADPAIGSVRFYQVKAVFP